MNTPSGPHWYVPFVTAAVMAWAIYHWEERRFEAFKPRTLTPVWELATFRRWWEWPREAGDPVILNPIRHNIPPWIKNLRRVDEIEEKSPKGGWIGEPPPPPRLPSSYHP